jgi:hypothetical protein
MMEELILSAYQKTRSSVYYDRMNLHTRISFSSGRGSKSIEAKVINTVGKVLDEGRKSMPTYPLLQSILNTSEVILQPKRLGPLRAGSLGDFHTNVDWANQYDVVAYNYFIDCSPELHVLSTLWVMIVGTLLERESSPDSYGWRLHARATDSDSLQLFTYYVSQYSKWRDQAIERARRTILDDKQSATIVGLDLKQFYYHAKIDWPAIDEVIEAADWDADDSVGDLETAKVLTEVLKAVCWKYNELLMATKELTHPEMNGDATPLPLGISFSPVLANWLLCDFDTAVRRELNPVYYGRYVDDLIFVISGADLGRFEKDDDPRSAFLSHYFVKRQILERCEESDPAEYHVAGHHHFKIQQSKIQLHHFHPDGSLGALDRFQNNIREIVSEFRFLPDAISTQKLEALSFELHYDGSKHSLKSVKGFEIDRWQLSHILTTAASTRIFATEGKQLKEESEALRRLLSGILGLKFHDMWEKIFAVMVLGEEFNELKRMYWHLRKCIGNARGLRVLETPIAMQRLQGKNDELEDHKLTLAVQRYYRKHLDSSLAMNIALVGWDNPALQKAWKSSRDQDLLLSIEPKVKAFRTANLIRHHFVGSPLINFSDDKGDWTKPRNSWHEVRIVPGKCSRSPRFIHLEEFDHAELLVQLGGNRKAKFAERLYKEQMPEESN